MKSNSKYRIRFERFLLIVIYLFVAISLVPFFWICWDLLTKGLYHLDVNLLIKSMADKTTMYLTKEGYESLQGGIVHALLGTVYIIFIALLVSIPIGLGSSIYMYINQGKKIAILTEWACRIISGVPSIIIGVIIYFWIVVPLHGFSALAGGIALAIIMIPLITLTTYQSLKQIPSVYVEEGIVLGGSKLKIITKILIPMASKNIKSGLLFSIGNSIGETTPLLFTALGSSMINWDLLQPTSTLTTFIWEIFETPRLSELLWSASLILFIITLLINVLANKYQENERKYS
ncbi:ABC transporter permease subunit [Bacteroidales bacterium OttesenSCG-928-M11]|nr:ABC transporter permease subunit [Bacteroidales bacterium OttesenSCG-928-M11]